jgi:hypothetical protein
MSHPQGEDSMKRFVIPTMALALAATMMAAPQAPGKKPATPPPAPTTTTTAPAPAPYTKGTAAKDTLKNKSTAKKQAKEKATETHK